jgi:hypothetical protein
VRASVDEDLPADELLAVEGLAEHDVARTQQDGAVGSAELPAQAGDNEPETIV